MQQGNHTAQSLYLANPIPAHMVAAVKQYAERRPLLGQQIRQWLEKNQTKNTPVST